MCCSDTPLQNFFKYMGQKMYITNLCLKCLIFASNVWFKKTGTTYSYDLLPRVVPVFLNQMLEHCLLLWNWQVQLSFTIINSFLLYHIWDTNKEFILPMYLKTIWSGVVNLEKSGKGSVYKLQIYATHSRIGYKSRHWRTGTKDHQLMKIQCYVIS